MIAAAKAGDLEKFMACFHPDGPKHPRFKAAGAFKPMMERLKTDEYRLEKARWSTLRVSR